MQVPTQEVVDATAPAGCDLGTRFQTEVRMASMDVPAGRPVAAPAAKVAVVKPTYITWLTLAFMTTASVASLRSAPTMAVYGLTCVFLYVVPAIVFLLPQALVAAELASGWTGGVFRWVSEGMSPRWGLLAVWCQFAMTIFYYPTLLAFVASTLAFVFNPKLADNGVYTGVVIVVVFWLGVFMSGRGGTRGIAKLASSRLLVGTLIPRAILVVLFDERSSLGLVRLRVKKASEEMTRLFDQVTKKAAQKTQPSILSEITDSDIDNLFND